MTWNKLLAVLVISVTPACASIVFDGFGPSPSVPTTTSTTFDKKVECTQDSQCESVAGEGAVCYKTDPHNYVGFCGKVENK